MVGRRSPSSPAYTSGGTTAASTSTGNLIRISSSSSPPSRATSATTTTSTATTTTAATTTTTTTTIHTVTSGPKRPVLCPADSGIDVTRWRHTPPAPPPSSLTPDSFLSSLTLHHHRQLHVQTEEARTKAAGVEAPDGERSFPTFPGISKWLLGKKEGEESEEKGEKPRKEGENGKGRKGEMGRKQREPRNESARRKGAIRRVASAPLPPTTTIAPTAGPFIVGPPLPQRAGASPLVSSLALAPTPAGSLTAGPGDHGTASPTAADSRSLPLFCPRPKSVSFGATHLGTIRHFRKDTTPHEITHLLWQKCDEVIGLPLSIRLFRTNFENRARWAVGQKWLRTGPAADDAGEFVRLESATLQACRLSDWKRAWYFMEPSTTSGSVGGGGASGSPPDVPIHARSRRTWKRYLVLSVRVKNVAFEKRVWARVTDDEWGSYRDVKGFYVESGAGDDDVEGEEGEWDRFVVEIDLTEALLAMTNDLCTASTTAPTFAAPISTASGPRRRTDHPVRRSLKLHFALGYTSAGETHWDSNHSQNYTCDVRLSGPPRSASPLTKPAPQVMDPCSPPLLRTRRHPGERREPTKKRIGGKKDNNKDVVASEYGWACSVRKTSGGQGEAGEGQEKKVGLLSRRLRGGGGGGGGGGADGLQGLTSASPACGTSPSNLESPSPSTAKSVPTSAGAGPTSSVTLTDLPALTSFSPPLTLDPLPYNVQHHPGAAGHIKPTDSSTGSMPRTLVGLGIPGVVDSKDQHHTHLLWRYPMLSPPMSHFHHLHHHYNEIPQPRDAGVVL